MLKTARKFVPTCIKCEINTDWAIIPCQKQRRLLSTCVKQLAVGTKSTNCRFLTRINPLWKQKFFPQWIDTVSCYSTLPGKTDYSKFQAYKPDWSLQEISIPCCSNMYIPKPEGIQMEVKYIDTANQLSEAQRSQMPTVLAAHGSPGSHEDWLGLVQPLVEKGFRLVIPNFPGELL